MPGANTTTTAVNATAADTGINRIIEFTPESLAALVARAISEEWAREFGIIPCRHPDDATSRGIAGVFVRQPGFLIPWRQPDGSTVWHYRPDVPVVVDGEPRKYVCPKRKDGEPNPLNHVRPAEPGASTLLVEGNLQTVAAARYAPDDWGVVGMNGCWGWRGADLTWALGKDIVVFHDADLADNRDVYDAIGGLLEALDAEEARSVRVARLLGGSQKDGLDDMLGRRPEHTRARFLVNLTDKATDKLPKAPPKRKSEFFDGFGGLKVETLTSRVLADHPAALTAEDKIALYRDGVYRIDGLGFTAAVARLLGEQHRPAHLSAAEQKAQATLYETGRVLRTHTDEPLVNLANGMLDLRTGELKPHDPAYLSTAQLPVAWDTEAQCPVYEAWLKEVCPDQVDDLEEVVSTMLNPSRTPSKAVFLFGPSRSGKSTFLRIMQLIAGGEVNVSAVTLHQLADNRFAAANLYGKILNAAADLSGADVSDLSLFKMLTGEDAVHADRKHGRQFAFTNTALFAFSANELPQVSESSRAYVERIKPFCFPHSFAGREDPGLERKIREELPGILVRWVKAWQRKAERGRYAETLPHVAAEFESRSDRVRQWFSEELAVTTKPGEGLKPAELLKLFQEWTEANGLKSLGRNTLTSRLKGCPGVREIRVGPSKTRALNVIKEPSADPFE
ncbi:phage/plasmid primase, P4 family [Streptomyces sp. NPDC102259]|uniref:DNA primase family protein n=1 Tax=Streptomyces sp. NPDC102259 TaxID=3366148 RepID=UPI00381AAE89